MTHIRFKIGLILVFILSAIASYFITNASKKQNENTQPVQTELPKEDNGEDEPNRWKSYETGIPAGVVVDGGYLEGMPSNNWLSIKTPDGTTTIVKNLDWQTHSAIIVGDIIE